MPLSAQEIEETLKQMQIPFAREGDSFVYAAPGRYADLISAVISLDEDLGGLTIVATLPRIEVKTGSRLEACVLLNLIHGQNLRHIRFHLDDEGRVLAIGALSLWGKPLNRVHFGDVLFTLLVSADRLAPCLRGIVDEKKTATEAFELFFLRRDPSQ